MTTIPYKFQLFLAAGDPEWTLTQTCVRPGEMPRDATGHGHATAAGSGAREAVLDTIELTGSFQAPSCGAGRGDVPPTPVKFGYVLNKRTREITVAVVPPFDPTAVGRAALKLVELCDDHTSGWRGQLRRRAVAPNGIDPFEFTASYDPQVGRVTVTLGARCSLALLRWAAQDLARKVHNEIGAPN
jgi:hypothetical protein